MKFFDIDNDNFRVVVYKSFDIDLQDRHQNWCNSKGAGEKPLYLIFLLQTNEEIKQWRSNKLGNSFCLGYEFEKPRTDEWLMNFCLLCFSEKDALKLRKIFRYKM